MDSPSLLVVVSMCRVALGCWNPGGGGVLIDSEWVGGCFNVQGGSFCFSPSLLSHRLAVNLSGSLKKCMKKSNGI